MTVDPSLVIALSALTFTIVSFWWINAKPGRLRMTEVVVFAGYVHPGRASLRIPVTLYNTGAKPLVVTDLRLAMSSGDYSAVAATKQYRKSIMPGQDDIEDFPYPYVVGGRSVVTKFVDFAADPTVMSTGIAANVEVRALIDRRGWRTVGKQQIRTDCMAEPEAYITYSNDPAHWPSRQAERAAKALAGVHAQAATLRRVTD